MLCHSSIYYSYKSGISNYLMDVWTLFLYETLYERLQILS